MPSKELGVNCTQHFFDYNIKTGNIIIQCKDWESQYLTNGKMG